MQELDGSTLKNYTIQSRLARGGMSTIYLARDEQQRSVAIKVVSSGNDEYAARFQHEVAALQVLGHEHILPVIDFGVHGSWHYCVMPYIEGGTLRQRLTKGPLSQQEAGNILAQVASAVQFAHDHGILHRDIKPSNILLKDKQHVYLADFGLAKSVEGGSDLTLTGCLIGTPEYMAPELAERPATMSSDIYALGVVLYQMLTGSLPFKASTPVAVYYKHIQEQPLPPSRLNPAISPEVEQVVLRALEKNPQDRFKSVQEMAEAYTRALDAPTSVEQTKVMLREAANATPVSNPTPVDMKLAAPTLRIIPVEQPIKPHRHFHPVLIAAAAVFFLVMVPMALGYTLHPTGLSLSIQAPVLRGASAEFAGRLPVKPVSTKTPVHTKTPVQTQNPVHAVIYDSDYQPRNGHKQGHGGGKGGGDNNGGDNSHLHKRGGGDD
ncbi:MAG TPA: serine/threonine-protein kinase [Ktedonobacteraceae bacterium]